MPDSTPARELESVATKFRKLVEDVREEVLEQARADGATARAADAARDALLLEIAKRHTCFETLETRNRDSLDFHEVNAEGLRRALVDAYEAGRAAATRDSGMRERLRRLPPDSAGLLAAMANTYRTTGGPHLDRRSVRGLSPEAVRETLDLAEADAAANSGDDAKRLVADLKRSLVLA